MKNNKRSRKGFTLIELIIVLAIFSVIMTLVMSFIDPVSRLMKKTSIRERTNSYVDNIGEYVDNSLRYAKFVQVCDSDFFKIGYPDDPLLNGGIADPRARFVANEKDSVLAFLDAIFDRARNADGDPLTGEVRVLEFINQNVGDLDSGMIYESSYDFTIGDPRDSSQPSTEITEKFLQRPVINSEHLENYDYYFRLGFWNLKPISNLSEFTVSGSALTDPGAGYYYSSLVRMDNSTGNIGPLPTNITSSYLPVNIVAYSNKGANRLNAVHVTPAGDVNEPVFKSPTFMNTVSLSLINAINAADNTNNHLAAYYKILYDGDGTPKKNAAGEVMFEAVSLNSLAVFSYDKATFAPSDTEENFYIIFILPYEVYDAQISLG